MRDAMTPSPSTRLPPPPTDVALAAVGGCYAAHALLLWRADRREAGVPIILAALEAQTCPASVLVPQRLLASGSLLPAAVASALAWAPREAEAGAARESLLAALAAHALAALTGRAGLISEQWPRARAAHVPALALCAARLRPLRLWRRLREERVAPPSRRLAERIGLGAAAVGLAPVALPAGPLARGCFECVGASAALPARALREACAPTALLGLCCAALQLPRSGRRRWLRPVGAASAALGATRVWELAGARGAGLRRPVRAVGICVHALCGAVAIRWLCVGEREREEGEGGEDDGIQYTDTSH